MSEPRRLYPASRVNTDQVVAGPFGQVDTIQIFQPKIVFYSVLVNDDTSRTRVRRIHSLRSLRLVLTSIPSGNTYYQGI